MSRLFGFFGDEPVNLSCEHRPETITTGSEDEMQIFSNSDGWGIGFFRNESSFLFKKPLKKKNSRDFTTISEIVSSRIFISHLRFASIGEVKEANTQPFRWGNWLFAHSGTIQQFRKVKSRIIRKLPIAYKKQIGGNTDSEYCFYLFLSMLRGEGGIKKGESSVSASVEGLKNFGNVMKEIFNEAEIQKEPVMNLLISNGKYLLAARYGEPLYYYVHEGSRDDSIPGFHFSETNVEFKTINQDPSKRFIVISTNKNNDGNIWKEIPDRNVMAIAPDMKIELSSWI